MNTAMDLRGWVPESWSCIDCGINTAPGLLNRAEMEQAFKADWNNEGVEQTVGELAEVYTVKPSIWKAAKMETHGGCLCIACLEKRIGRSLVPKDFPRDPLNKLPGKNRLLERRGDRGAFPPWSSRMLPEHCKGTAVAANPRNPPLRSAPCLPTS